MADVVVEGTPLKAKRAIVAVKKFKLLEGKQHMHDGVELKAGDVVLFNKDQAHAFRDKFAPVDASPFKVYSEEEETKFVESETNRRVAAEKQQP
jgi:hypothetical protein